MQTRYKLVIGAWAASLGFAFYTGYSVGQPTVNITENNIAANNIESSSDTQKLGSSSKSSTKKEKQQSRLRISPVKKHREPVNIVMADLKALLGNGMTGMDMAAFAESYNLVKDLSEEELTEALSLLQGDLKSPGNMMPLMLILGKYAEFDPLNAVAFYENNITSPQTKMMALGGILSSWSKTDPEAAYDWYLEKNKNSKNSSVMGNAAFGMTYIFKGLANNDMGSAIEKLKSLNPIGYEAQMAASGIANSLREKEDFIDFFEKTKEIDNQKIKGSILQNWVDRNPQEVVAWLETQEEDEHSQKNNQQVLRSWMSNNPQEAAEWYLGKAEDKQKAADTVVQQWTWRNPEAAMDWVKDKEGIDPQKSLQKILESSVYQNPEFAIKNINKLESTGSQQKLSVRIYAYLKNQSKSKAAEFLAASPFKDQINKTLNKKK